MIKKLLQKNIRLSYQLIGFIDRAVYSAQEGIYRMELKMFLQSCTDIVKGKNVLDVGSGSWTWSQRMFAPICDITTFDMIPHENVDVVGDLYRLNEFFPGEPRFDVVIATDVFEHVAHLSQALQAVRSVLRPHGMLIISTPFKKNLHGEEYGDYWRITRQGWQHLLEQTGFEQCSITWLGEELLPQAYFVLASKK